MSLLNTSRKTVRREGIFEVFLQLLNPFAPHITEEHEMLGNANRALDSPLASYDEGKTKDERITFAIQGQRSSASTVTLEADSTDGG